MTTKSDATGSTPANKGKANDGTGDDAGRQNGGAVTSRFLQYLPSIFQKSIGLTQNRATLQRSPTFAKSRTSERCLSPKSEDGRRAEELWVNDFLLAFEQEYTRVDDLLATIDQYFSPTLLNTDDAPDFLPWLASWVALTLDEEWDEEKRRRLIGEAVKLYRWRGTAFGLKRYLEIYTGLDPQAITMVDGYRPGGMQIGVASRIGQEVTPSSAPSITVQPPVATAGEAPVRKQDAYYIVDTVTPTDVLPGAGLPDLPDNTPLQLYYAVAPTAGYHVERVQLEEEGVRLWVHLAKQAEEESTADNTQTEPTVKEYFHRRPPNMTKANIRRSSATDYGYFLEQRQDNGKLITRTYHGGSFLVEQMEAPYHFMIDLHEAPTERAAEIDLLWQRLTKIQAILEREKPAHTVYHLNIRPTAELATHQWMQIEVRSTIGLDSTIG